MDQIIVITPDELKTLISEAIKEHFHCAEQSKENISDTLSLSDAMFFLKANGYPTSKGKIYQLTSQGNMPFGKYGNRLVFSRKALLNWAANRTCQMSTEKFDTATSIRASVNRKMK